MRERILVTGAQAPLGGALTELLRGRGSDVVAMDLPPGGELGPGREPWETSHLLAAAADADMVIDLARPWMGARRRAARELARAWARTMISAARVTRRQRLVRVFHEIDPGGAIAGIATGDKTPSPERDWLSIAHPSARITSMALVVLRLGSVVGGSSGGEADHTWIIRQGLEAGWLPAAGAMGLLPAAAAARAIEAAARLAPHGRFYCLEGEVVSLPQLAALMHELTGVTVEPAGTFSRWTRERLSRKGPGRPRPVRLSGPMGPLETGLAEAELGYLPPSPEAALRETLLWLVEEGRLESGLLERLKAHEPDRVRGGAVPSPAAG